MNKLKFRTGKMTLVALPINGIDLELFLELKGIRITSIKNFGKNSWKIEGILEGKDERGFSLSDNCIPIKINFDWRGSYNVDCSYQNYLDHLGIILLSKERFIKKVSDNL